MGRGPRCWSAAKAGSSTVCRSPWTSAKPSSLGCATGARGTRATCSSAYAPAYAPFTSSEPVRRALCKAYRRAGLVPPGGGQARTHALRHGLAMALLDRGSSLGEIGDVLRHRSARSTTAYARYDHGALRPLARPVAGAGRGTMIPVAERRGTVSRPSGSPSEPACRPVRFGN